MNIVNAVAKIRLTYHLNMLDIVNVANQLGLLSDEKADLKNKNHFKKCLDCYNRLGLKLPKAFIEFMNEEG